MACQALGTHEFILILGAASRPGQLGPYLGEATLLGRAGAHPSGSSPLHPCFSYPASPGRPGTPRGTGPTTPRICSLAGLGGPRERAFLTSPQACCCCWSGDRTLETCACLDQWGRNEFSVTPPDWALPVMPVTHGHHPKNESIP